MKNRTLVLWIAGLAVCVLAVVAYQASKPSGSRSGAASGKARGAPLFAELGERAGDVARVEFTEGEAKIVLVRGDASEWSVESQSGYAADPSKISRLVYDLTDITVADQITARSEKYAGFGVEGDVGENGTLLLSDGSGGEIARLVLGKEREVDFESNRQVRGGGRFVLVGGDPNVYLVEESLYWLDPKLTAWVDTKIASIAATEVETVEIDHGEGSTETLHVANEFGALKLQETEKGKRAKSWELTSLRSALSSLNLSGVVAVDSLPTEFTPDVLTTYTATTRNGTTYQVRTLDVEGKTCIEIRASEGEPVIGDVERASTETLATRETEIAAAREAIPAFNDQHAPWLYELSDYVCKKFTKKRSDLLEPIPEDTEEDEE